MATLCYSPGIRILISTARHGVIDVTDDISDGIVSLRESQPHTFNINIVNHRRKYDGVFTPNDKVVIRLKRLRWLQVFAGYLSGVPFFSVYPRTINISGECTLKRLRFRLWDKGAGDTVEFLNSLNAAKGASGSQLDDSFKNKAIAVLTTIAEWKQGIHIGRLPEHWLARVDKLMQTVFAEYDLPAEFLGSTATVGGTDIGSIGSDVVVGSNGQIEGGPGYGTLPTRNGAVMSWTGVGPMAITGEQRLHPNDQWYAALRVPYLEPEQAKTMSAAEIATAKAWWMNRKIVVGNPKTNGTIVARVADFGPDPATGKALGLSPQALQALGAVDGDQVTIRFADSAAPTGSDGIQPGDTSTGAPATPAPSVTPGIVIGDSGSTKGSKSGLRPNAALAWDFIAQQWPQVKAIGGVRHDANAQDHGKGLAIDVMMTMDGTAAQGEDKALGNSVASFFINNPDAFDISYVIWYGRINSDNRGWREYHGNLDNSPNQMHQNHVHISFRDTGRSTIGPMGNPRPGGNDMPGGYVTSTGGVGGVPIIDANNWFATHDYRSTILVGIRALMNDEPILPFIGQLMNTSMRSYCSAPNGDFIGWFPDYFGAYGTAGAVDIQPIELLDFTVGWSDERLKTHVFTAGSATGYGSPTMDAEVAARESMTKGIASVEFPEILQALLNIDPADPDAAGWMDPKAILDRFGARVDYQPMGTLVGDEAEFWYALFLFQKNWAEQFTAQAPITFMPELFPGMLMRLPNYGIQFYVSGVDHHFTFSGSGGGFETTVMISAPSAIGGRGLFGLPRGGRL